MDITFLRHEGNLCGLYLDNGILLDARKGIGEALKEHGLQPKTVYLTSTSGDAVSGLEELDGVPIGNSAVDPTTIVTQFPVGAKGNRKYGFRVKTSDGELVYAPEFDRVEKSKISGVGLAVLDPGDRSEDGDLSGLSHRAYKAREHMTGNSKIVHTIWTDNKSVSNYTLGEPKPVVPAPVTKEVDLTGVLEALDDDYRDQFQNFNTGDNYSYICRYFDNHVVVRYNGELYEVNYSGSGGEYTFEDFTKWTKVEIVTSYQPVEKSQLVVTKEQDGKLKWFSISSSDFRDSDGEKVSTTAMDFAIAVNKVRGSYGNLVWGHHDELPLGPCLSQIRVGKFLVETGEFYDTPLGMKAAEKIASSEPGQYRISIGFNYWQGTRSEDGEFSAIDIFHRAVTDHPSNAATSIEVIKMTRELSPAVLKQVQDTLGMTDDEMKTIVAQAKIGVKEDKPGVSTALKEGEQPPATPAVPAVPAAKTPEVPAVVPTVEERLKAAEDLIAKQAAQLVSYKDDVATEVKNKLLAALKDAPSGDVVRPTTSGKHELTEDEKTKLKEAQDAAAAHAANGDAGFDKIYGMFGSNQPVPARA